MVRVVCEKETQYYSSSDINLCAFSVSWSLRYLASLAVLIIPQAMSILFLYTYLCQGMLPSEFPYTYHD